MWAHFFARQRTDCLAAPDCLRIQNQESDNRIEMCTAISASAIPILQNTYG